MRQRDNAGRAAEILAQCETWAPVEHLIIYNVERMSVEQAHTMMAKGRRILTRIPGVREVCTGEALKEGAKYRFY